MLGQARAPRKGKAKAPLPPRQDPPGAVKALPPHKYRERRYGCQLCPKEHFKKQGTPLSGDNDTSVERHVRLKHPQHEASRWGELCMLWGYRIFLGNKSSQTFSLEELSISQVGSDLEVSGEDEPEEAGSSEDAAGDAETEDVTAPNHQASEAKQKNNQGATTTTLRRPKLRRDVDKQPSPLQIMSLVPQQKIQTADEHHKPILQDQSEEYHSAKLTSGPRASSTTQALSQKPVLQTSSQSQPPLHSMTRHHFQPTDFSSPNPDIAPNHSLPRFETVHPQLLARSEPAVLSLVKDGLDIDILYGHHGRVVQLLAHKVFVSVSRDLETALKNQEDYLKEWARIMDAQMARSGSGPRP